MAESQVMLSLPSPSWRGIRVGGEPPKVRSGHTSIPLGDRILVFGGGGESVYYDDVVALDIVDKKWRTPTVDGQAPCCRAYHTAVLVGSQVFIFGGWKGDQFLNDLHMLDGAHGLRTDKYMWSSPRVTGTLPSPRAYHTSTAAGAKMLVFGGWFMDFCNDLMVLDTAALEWSVQATTGTLPKARAAHSATLVDGRRMLVFGGESQDGRLKDVWALDTKDMHWTELATTGEPPSPRSGHTAEVWGEWLVVFGGWDGDRHLQDTHLLHLETMHWLQPQTPAGREPMGMGTPDARSGHTCCVMGGRLYLLGGWDRTTFLNDAWMLDRPPSRSSPERSRPTSPAQSEDSRERQLAELVRADAAAVMEGLPEWHKLLAMLDSAATSNAVHASSGRRGHGSSRGSPPSAQRSKLKAQVLGQSLGAGCDLDAPEAVRPPPSRTPQTSATGELPIAQEQLSTPGAAAAAATWATSRPGSGNARGSPSHAAAGGCESGKGAGSSCNSVDSVRATRPRNHLERSRLRKSASFSGRDAGGRGVSAGVPWMEAHVPLRDGYGGGSGETGGWLAWYLGRGAASSPARRMRGLVGTTGKLCEQLQRELRTFKAYREELNDLASTVDVQPLFSSYSELLQIQETIRNAALSGAVQQAQALVGARDEMHTKCLTLSKQLHTKVEKVIGKQHERRTHLTCVLQDLSQCLGATEMVLASMPAAEGAAADAGLADLPDFLMASDAVEALEEPMRVLQAWRDAELSRNDTRDALAATDAAMRQLNAAIETEVGVLEQTPDGSLASGRAALASLMAAARGFLHHLNCETLENTGEMEHTQSLLADCGSMANKLQLVGRQRSESVALQAELAETSRALMTMQEEVIRMNADVELARLHDSGSPDLAAAEAALERVKAAATAHRVRKEELGEALAALAREHHPELLCVPQGELSQRLGHTGLVVKRTLADYEQVKMLHDSRQHVMLCRYNRKLCVLKEVTLHDEGTRKVFENEVNLLWKLQHPAIISVDAVFYDTLRAYIQMPYVAGGTMRRWLYGDDRADGAPPKPWEVQSVFRQLLQGLAYLHDHGIVHRDMKLDNVLMEPDGLRPIICDLGISKDRSQLLDGTSGTATATSTTTVDREHRTTDAKEGGGGGVGGGGGGAGGKGRTVKGTEGYIAPEVLAGEGANSAADMWAVGVMLHKAMFRSDPAVEAADDDGLGRVPIPPHDNEALRQLLGALLCVNPRQRISANEALSFPYFTKSFVRGLYENKQILESDSKLHLLQQHVRTLQEGRAAVSMRVRRASLVQDTVSIFAEMEGDTIFFPINVRFIGEPGVDAGGLTSDLYTDFFNRLLTGSEIEPAGPMSPLGGGAVRRLPSAEEAAARALAEESGSLDASGFEALFEAPAPEDTPLSGVAYLPSSKNMDLHTYRMIGRILVKSIIDGRPIPARFAPSFFKYLLGIEPSLRDMELYDRTLATSLQAVLLKPVANLGIFFEPISPAGEEAAGSGAAEAEPVPVTDSNKLAYVQSRVHHTLVGCREAQLRAIKEGFQEVDLQPYLQMFSCTDLMLLVCGEEHLDAHMVIEMIEFSPSDWPETSSTPNDLLEFLRELRRNDLRRFLRLATSQCTITRGVRMPVTIHRCPQSDRLPVGRTCFRRVDLPDYNDAHVLHEKMLLALATVDGSGFGMS